MPILETERLFIREFTLEDVDPISTVLSNPEVMKYSFRGVQSAEGINDYIKDCLANYKNHGFGQWAVIHKQSNQFVGVAGLNPGFDGDENIIHLAARFALPYWGKGYASEALKGIENYAKEVLGKKELYALIEPINKRSVKIILKNGFQFQKESIYQQRALKYYLKLL